MSQGQLLRRKSSQKIDALSQQVREFLSHHPRTSIKDEYQDQEHALFLKVVPDHMKASAEIARRFQDIYESTKNNEDVTDYEERLDKILQVAKGLVKTEGLDMVQHSLSCFVKHNPELKRDVLIPQFEFRRPDLITPTAIKVDPRDFPENKLDWWRLDPSIADHHDHWHQVYPMFYSDKLPKAKPRQGEMFYYVHEQMLARYDADRLGVGLPPVKPLNDYHAPIPEAFHRPQRAGLSRAREANMKFKDVRWPKTIGAQANFQADQVVTIKQFEVMRDRLMEAIKQGKLKNPPGVEPEYVEMTDWNLGETHEADVASVNTTYYDADDLDPDGNKTAGHHSTGHMMVANVHFNDSAPSLKDIGTIADHSTAPRDPVFYRWHKHVDEFWLAWQDRKPKYNTQTFLDDNAKISIRPQDIIVVFRDRIVDNKGDLDAWGKWKFAETPQDWGTDFSRFGLGTNEFQTEMQIRTVSGTSKDQQADWNEDMWKVPYLTHRGFVWFLRLENNTHQVQTGTARIWMCPIETAENRRSWIEMDKFKVIIPPKQKQVFARPDFLSSVIRKPTLPFADTGPIGAGADPYGPENNKDDDFCDCGWPYHMLLPRGTRTGMKFKLMVIITNGHDLLIENNECCCSLGSISYCGTSGRKEYPDTKPMGYPFDRQFEESIQQTFAGLESVATREITIRRIDNYYGPEEQETQGSVPEPTPTPVPAPAPASSSSLEERGLVTSMKTVTPKGAQLLIELGKKKAAELGVKPCFAVVDRFGNLLAFHREDNSVNDLIINLAISKARTAVCVRNSTQAFADLISPQGDHWGVNPANSGMVTLGGGEVVKVNGELVGGFGVSAGGNWGNDSAISKAAVDGFTSSS